MSLFRIEGAGIVKDIFLFHGKRVVEIPKDWKCSHVRIYKLHEIKSL